MAEVLRFDKNLLRFGIPQIRNTSTSTSDLESSISRIKMTNTLASEGREIGRGFRDPRMFSDGMQSSQSASRCRLNPGKHFVFSFAGDFFFTFICSHRILLHKSFNITGETQSCSKTRCRKMKEKCISPRPPGVGFDPRVFSGGIASSVSRCGLPMNLGQG